MAFLNNAEEKARNHIFKKMNSSSTAFGFYSNNKRGKFNIIKEKNPLLRKEKILSCFQHHIQVMHHWYNSSLKEIPFLLQYLWLKKYYCIAYFGFGWMFQYQGENNLYEYGFVCCETWFIFQGLCLLPYDDIFSDDMLYRITTMPINIGLMSWWLINFLFHFNSDIVVLSKRARNERCAHCPLFDVVSLMM